MTGIWSEERVVPDELLSIGAAAQRLGVSASTLRSWERRYGISGPQRTTGTHRRYSAADLARLSAMLQLTRTGMPVGQAAALVVTAAATRPGQAGLAELADRLAGATEDMDAAHITAILHVALLRHGVIVTWNELLMPLLIRVGDRWREHGDGVDAEHVLSDAAQAVLRSHARPRPPAVASPVLLLAVPGERHTLPLAALSAALAEQGVATVLLADLPAADLTHALSRLRPAKVLVWARNSGAPGSGTLRALRQLGRQIYAAGPGWDPSTLPPAVPHLSSFAAALRALGPPAQARPA